MKISQINNVYNANRVQKSNKAGVSVTSNVMNTATVNEMPKRSIYDKGFANVSFGGVFDELSYPVTLGKHAENIAKIEPGRIENYCASLGVDCSLKDAKTKADKQFLGYSIYKTMEMMRQLNLPLPTSIFVYDLGPKELALTSVEPGTKVVSIIPPRKAAVPARSIIYNRQEPWEAYLYKNSMEMMNPSDNFNSTKHFLHPSIHEFAHSAHLDKIYSKFGAPFPDNRYPYNPNTAKLIDKLKTPLFDKYGNPVDVNFISPFAKAVMSKSSEYGQTMLAELLAEEFTRAIIEHMDFNTLRLKSYPFDQNKLSPALNGILQETWEGLIDDGKGHI